METYKIILVGDPSVGKTNLLTQYVDEKFTENNTNTVGIEFKNKTIELKNGRKIRLQIWDTCGQEKIIFVDTMLLYLFLMLQIKHLLMIFQNG